MSDDKSEIYNLINKLGIKTKEIPENLSDVTEEFSFILGSGKMEGNMIKVNDYIYRTSLMELYYDIGRVLQTENFKRAHMYFKHDNMCILLCIQDISDTITECNGNPISITTYNCKCFDMDSSKIKNEESILDLKSESKIIKTNEYSKIYYFNDKSMNKSFLESMCNIKLEGENGKSIF